MAIEWYMAARIKISESAYLAWLAADVDFNFEVTFINPMEAAPDSIIGAVTDFAKEKTKKSTAYFFANELLWQSQNSPESLFYFRYDKEHSHLDFVMGIKTISDGQVSKILAALLSITNFKNITGCDMCILSKSDFKNVRYINEIYPKNIIIMPKVTTEYFIPENLQNLYQTALDTNHSLHEKLSLIEKEIEDEFKKIISERIAPGIDEILKNSSEEHPSLLTENSLFQTDGKNVLSNEGTVVDEADPRSFKSLGGFYAADFKNVYYNSSKINGADPYTFTVLYWDYAKDKSHAYFNGNKIADISGGDFKALRPAYGYAASDRTVFYCGKEIIGSDPSSFHAIGEGRQNDSIYFGADKNNVYLEGKIIPYIDSQTFEHIGKHFFKDCKYVYVDSSVIEGCRPENARALNNYHIADNYDAFFVKDGDIVQLSSPDVAGLKVNDFIAADKINVYYQGIKIQGADGATAEIFDQNEGGYIIDKNSVFYCDVKIPANKNTFHTLGFGYATDGEKVFFRDSIVKNAHPETFTATSYGSASDKFAKYSFTKQIAKITPKNIKNLGGNYFKDEKYIYYKVASIKNVDYDTFSPIPITTTNGNDENSVFSEYAKDKNKVYYQGLAIDDADSSTFKLIEYDNDSITKINDEIEKGDYGKDIKNVYYQGFEVLTATPSNFKPHEIEKVWVSNTSLFHEGKPINDIDLNTFTPVGLGFYKDATRVFYGITSLDGMMPDNFSVVSYNYVKDDTFFCYVEKLPDGCIITNLFEADFNSFDLIEFNAAFAYDRNGLFFRGNPIENLDISNISYLDDNYLRDNNNIFCGNIQLQGVNIDGFTPLGSGYASDGHISFYQGILLQTEKPIHVLGNGYATDGDTFWLYGQEIENPQDDLFLRETLGVIL